MEALKIRDLSFKYPRSERLALNKINLTVREGEFVLLCGGTGCGKTTLLRLIKSSIAPHGERNGDISVFGREVSSLGVLDEATAVGMVMQRPESQIVSENTLDELSFGLCSLGMPTHLVHRRIAEVSGYFGIDHWADKSIDSLSGGQKQILNLASVIAMRPGLLLLDEPTSRLDPISSADFISAVTRLNRETGITVVMSEHRLESAFPLCDRVLFMREGEIIIDEPPNDAVSKLALDGTARNFLSPATRIFAGMDIKRPLPLTVRDAREIVNNLDIKAPYDAPTASEDINKGDILLKAENLYFRYEKNSKDVLVSAELTVRVGEVVSIMGGNAAGKTTLVKCLAGLLKPYDGRIMLKGKKLSAYQKQELYGNTVAYLPQDVNAVFTCQTVAEELAVVGIKREDIPDSLKPYADTHPYDLSGGEQQKCAITKLIAKKPALLILDEPTKGLDPVAVSELAKTVKELSSSGMAVICVTHDAELAAEISTSVVLMFGGNCCEKEPPSAFFTSNSFYTTAASRISKGSADNVYKSEQLVSLLKNGEKS